VLWKRLLAGTVIASGLFVGLIGFAHTKPGRPLRPMLVVLNKVMGATPEAKGGACPLGYDQGGSPAEVEAARKRSVAQFKGAAPSSVRPAFGFSLGVTPRKDVESWAAEHRVSCTKQGPMRLVCAQVPSTALPAGFQGVDIDEVYLQFDPQEHLVSVGTVRSSHDAEVVLRTHMGLTAELQKKLGEPSTTSGKPDLEYLRGGLLRQVRSEFRFSDYYATSSVTAMGQGRFVISERYELLADGSLGRGATPGRDHRLEFGLDAAQIHAPVAFHLEPGSLPRACGPVSVGREPDEAPSRAKLPCDRGDHALQQEREVFLARHAVAQGGVGQHQGEARDTVPAGVDGGHGCGDNPGFLQVFPCDHQGLGVQIRAMDLGVGAQPRALAQLETRAGEGVPDHILFLDPADEGEGSGDGGVGGRGDIRFPVTKAKIGERVGDQLAKEEALAFPDQDLPGGLGGVVQQEPLGGEGTVGDIPYQGAAMASVAPGDAEARGEGPPGAEQGPGGGAEQGAEQRLSLLARGEPCRG
jgi:hypothetical protein